MHTSEKTAPRPRNIRIVSPPLTSHSSTSTGACNNYQKRLYMPPFLIHCHSSSRFSCQRTSMCSAPHERPSKHQQLYSIRQCQRVNTTYTTLVRSAQASSRRPPTLLFLHIPSPSPVSPCAGLSSVGYIVDHEGGDCSVVIGIDGFTLYALHGVSRHGPLPLVVEFGSDR